MAKFLVGKSVVVAEVTAAEAASGDCCLSVVPDCCLQFKKISNSLSISFILLRLRLGITVAMWVNFGRHMVFITVILPKTVKKPVFPRAQLTFNLFKTVFIIVIY